MLWPLLRIPDLVLQHILHNTELMRFASTKTPPAKSDRRLWGQGNRYFGKKHNMEFYVEYSCEDNNETGKTKLTVSEFDTTTIRDVKYAIQTAIQAPVCDQQLFYQGQPVTDDDMTLSRLYFREGDCFKVKFLAAVDIAGMTELLDVLKKSAQDIVEKLNRRPPSKLETEDNSANGLSQRFYSQWQYHLVIALDELSFSFFSPWKQLRTTAQRHFFVQEGGFDAFLEVFKYSQRVNLVEDDIK